MKSNKNSVFVFEKALFLLLKVVQVINSFSVFSVDFWRTIANNFVLRNILMSATI